MKSVYDEFYKNKFINIGINKDGELHHLISDAATMQIIRWTKGGFGMCAHNYDGDMLTDEIAQVHRSPGFITSNLIGKSDDGRTAIKEFEASHGTVSDLFHAHLRGEETSMNPLGMVEALLAAMQHSAILTGGPIVEQINTFTNLLRKAMHNTFRYGQGTRDMAGPTGLTTEQFIDKVAWRLGRYIAAIDEQIDPSIMATPTNTKKIETIDKNVVQELFDSYDLNKTGKIGMNELEAILERLNVAPQSLDKLIEQNNIKKSKMGTDKCTV